MAETTWDNTGSQQSVPQTMKEPEIIAPASAESQHPPLPTAKEKVSTPTVAQESQRLLGVLASMKDAGKKLNLGGWASTPPPEGLKGVEELANPEKATIDDSVAVLKRADELDTDQLRAVLCAATLRALVWMDNTLNLIKARQQAGQTDPTEMAILTEKMAQTVELMPKPVIKFDWLCGPMFADLLPQAKAFLTEVGQNQEITLDLKKLDASTINQVALILIELSKTQELEKRKEFLKQARKLTAPPQAASQPPST